MKIFRSTVASISRLLAVCLCSVLVLACSGPQQTTKRMPADANDAAAPMGTNSIIVQVDTTGDAAYQVAAQVLQGEGYSLANSDSELYSITTNFRDVATGRIIGVEYGLRVSFGVVGTTPASAKFTATVEDEFGQRMRVQKKGQSGSLMRSAWADLFTVAYQVSERLDGQLSYR